MSIIANQLTATIPAAASLSGALQVGAGVPVTILTPAAWTAAVLTFQISIDGSTWYDLVDATDTEVQMTVPTGKAKQMDAPAFSGVSYLRLRSGTSATPVAQAAERQFLIIARKERAK